jgi:putative two-component system response regulator
MEFEVDNATILIVDDTPANIDVLREVLRDRYFLKIATSGARALEIVAGSTPPDLVLLDIMMPGMDGYEVCRRMKAAEATRRIPVVFVTAVDDIENEARGFEAGCVDYIIKPVSEPLVLARVATHVRLARQDQLLQTLLQERALLESPLSTLGGRSWPSATPST